MEKRPSVATQSVQHCWQGTSEIWELLFFIHLCCSPGDGGAVRSASLALFAHCTDELLLLVSASAALFVCFIDGSALFSSCFSCLCYRCGSLGLSRWGWSMCGQVVNVVFVIDVALSA